MEIRVVDALRVQRELLDLPRSMERFDAYVATMIGEDDQVELPLQLFNPMAKEQVAELLDGLIAFGAEDIARDAAAEAAGRIAGPGELSVVALVVDDAEGGWTNRYITDFEMRFGRFSGAPRWAMVPVWSSEEPSPDGFRGSVLRAVARTVHINRAGHATTLRQMLFQEGSCAALAGVPERTLDRDDTAYTLDVIGPHLDSDERPTQMACLYGDEAAREVGYEPLGLSPWAGLAVAPSFASAP